MPRAPRDYAREYARRVAGTPKGSRERQIARGHSASERPGQIRHVEPSQTRPDLYPEMWVVGKPGPRGGGRPTATRVLKALNDHITTSRVRIAVTVVPKAGSTLSDQIGEGKRYPALVFEGIGTAAPLGAVVPRNVVENDLTTIAALPKADQPAALAAAAERWTGRTGEFSDVLTIALANR